jgi:hypothetical protein
LKVQRCCGKDGSNKEFTLSQPVVNAGVTSVWQEWPTGATTIWAPTTGREKKIMGMGKNALVALIVLVGAGAPVLPGVSFAQPAPSAGAATRTAASLTPDEKAALLKKLADAKQHDRDARKGWSQEPLTQAGYDEKIQEINRLVDKLNKGEDFPLSDVDKAVASPGTAPY